LSEGDAHAGAGSPPSEMVLLALDTSSAAVTVALHDGTRVIVEETEIDPRRHAELLAPMIAKALRGAGVDRGDLTAVAVGVGPGPYTGLRAGMSTASVMGHALDIPVYGVCSLDAMAEQAVSEERLPTAAQAFLVASDARRQEVYWAPYLLDGPRLRRVGSPSVGDPAALPRLERPVVGRGAELYPEYLGPALEPFEPSAGALARLAVRALIGGESGLLLPVEPLYLRRPDATAPAGRKRVLAG
jgi:tRNA threonylcarbamoyladenosine biosynthesis protein TsaB